MTLYEVRWILTAVFVVAVAGYAVWNRRRIRRLEATIVELRKAEAIVNRAHAEPRRRHLRVVPDTSPGSVLALRVKATEVLDELPPLLGRDRL